MDRGALNFVIVGGGPTGVEVAGAIADMIYITLPAEYEDLDAAAASVHLLDYGDALLKPFSDKAHGYVSKVLEREGRADPPGHGRQGGRHRPRASVGRHDRSPTRCVVWGGGIKAAAVAADGGLAQGRGGRVDVERRPDAGRPRGRVRDRRHRQHSRRRRRRRSRSWARSRCRAATGPPTTSSPTSRASPASRSPTTTRGSWR